MTRSFILMAVLSFHAVCFAQQNCSELFADKSLSTAKTLSRLVSEEQMLGQSDPILNSLGLLVPNGGLCASACAANVITTLYHHSRLVPPMDNVGFVIKILDAHLKQTNNDGRIGMTLLEVSVALEKLDLSEKRIAFFSEFFSREKITEETLKDQADALHIVVLNLNQGYHALVIFDFNSSTKTLSYFDPNNPHIVKKASYHILNRRGLAPQIIVKTEAESLVYGRIEQQLTLGFTRGDSF